MALENYKTPLALEQLICNSTVFACSITCLWIACASREKISEITNDINRNCHTFAKYNRMETM